ncbi:hypothetical protein [Spirillospora sp. NPDC029432]|uniref:hypothetical protein n=1 Tax=Spirillospora sp. NPDC029432 TaxID=3154599 RepID=UPI003452FD45
MWKHRTLADAAELPETPPAVPPEQAQPWCNFVLWTPGRVPAGCELETGTLRKEAPPGRVEGHTAGRTPWSDNNPAAYRFEIAGSGRRLRVKQFLYDWAFPALDHPCLWESRTHAAPIDDRHVVWFGTDYLKNAAASARLDRTTVELSVLRGTFSEAEILDLYRAMRPAEPAVLADFAATPFAALSYWARRPEAAAVNVPVGLWTFRRRRSRECRWESGAAAERLVAGLGLPLALGGLDLDGAARFTDDQGREEVEAVYSGRPERGRELRLIAQESGRGSLRVPAEPEDQPGERDTVRVAGAEVQLGWIDERYGPFQAVYAHGGVEATLLASTAVGMDRAWFLEALAEAMP